MIDLAVRFIREKAEKYIKDANNTKQNDERGREQSHNEFQRVSQFK